ncbi:hypothetical protein CHS0354_026673 [Potamilus streckersoni]|uniref:Uncharacterized protein n=1 Tax=Potamilus streckersoni TaxID=2493646 RepID=A0AAE0S7T9_9BIVA|nr:hypothetical protein CHS0354_026673 [Potamilus streckersoni]
MGESTEMPFQAGEKIRADSGQEVPFTTRKGEKKMGQSTDMPFKAGEIRADSGEEVPLQA